MPEAALRAAVRALEEKAAIQRAPPMRQLKIKNMNARLLDQSSADAASARIIRDMIFHRDAQLEGKQSDTGEELLKRLA